MPLSLQSRKVFFAACVPTLVLLGLAAPARAVEPLDTFSVRIGGYITSFDTEVRADGQGRRGTPISLDSDLGLDDDNIVANLGLTWRPWQRHEFGLAYYRQSSDSTRVIDRDFNFEDHFYQTSSTVHSEVDMDAYEASYVWWAASRENWALGPRVGLIWYRIELSLRLEADVNGEPVNGSIGDEVEADVPAPTIGASWRWSPAEQWRFSADAGYFTLSVDDIDGDVYFGRVGVEWFPWRSAGFSLDYTSTRIKVDSNKSSFNGNVDFTDAGLRLGFVYRF